MTPARGPSAPVARSPRAAPWRGAPGTAAAARLRVGARALPRALPGAEARPAHPPSPPRAFPSAPRPAPAPEGGSPSARQRDRGPSLRGRPGLGPSASRLRGLRESAATLSPLAPPRPSASASGPPNSASGSHARPTACGAAASPRTVSVPALSGPWLSTRQRWPWGRSSRAGPSRPPGSAPRRPATPPGARSAAPPGEQEQAKGDARDSQGGTRRQHSLGGGSARCCPEVSPPPRLLVPAGRPGRGCRGKSAAAGTELGAELPELRRRGAKLFWFRRGRSGAAGGGEGWRGP